MTLSSKALAEDPPPWKLLNSPIALPKMMVISGRVAPEPMEANSETAFRSRPRESAYWKMRFHISATPGAMWLPTY